MYPCVRVCNAPLALAGRTFFGSLYRCMCSERPLRGPEFEKLLMQGMVTTGITVIPRNLNLEVLTNRRTTFHPSRKFSMTPRDVAHFLMEDNVIYRSPLYHAGVDLAIKMDNMLHLIQVSGREPGNHSLVETMYTSVVKGTVPNPQSVLEFWYHAAFSASLPPEFHRLQGALRLYRRVAPKGELTRSKARAAPANVGLDIAYEATQGEILPRNVTYWYFHSQGARGYRPRFFPRFVNTSPRVLYAPLEAVYIGKDDEELRPLLPVKHTTT